MARGKRQQRLRRDHANQYDSRHFKDDLKLPPLIAPQSSSSQHEPRERLPSIEDLDLLRAGRGVFVPQLAEEDLRDDEILVLENRVLKEYLIYDTIYVMQAPVKNENSAIAERTTVGNRRLRYILEVAQPPKQARACGNGPRSSADRRPVDPPPVVKLRVMQGDVDITGHYEASFMLYASLEFARPIAGTAVYASNHCPVLTGTNVAGAAYLVKPSNAAYFIFPDLSVRHEGYYRLKFHLFEQIKHRDDMDPRQLMPVPDPATLSAPNPQEDMVNRTFVYSPPFQVFSAKKFPGLEQSTELSRCIADQGCRVRIRRDIRQRKSEVKSDKKGEDQRSLRALSHDRVSSIDGQDQWSRSVPPIDTRQTSIDSQMTQGYGNSRHQSYGQSHSTLPSPIIGGPYTPHTVYDTPTPIASEPEEMWNPSYRSGNYMPSSVLSRSPALQQPPMSQPFQQRRSYAPISPAASTLSVGLPSISSIINPPMATELPRPQGGLYPLSSPVAKKRSLGRASTDTSSALKDRARPSSKPPSPRSALGWISHGGDPGARLPMVGGNDIIEAGDDTENEDGDHHSDSEDSLLNYNHTYKRADGGKSHVPDLSRRY